MQNTFLEKLSRFFVGLAIFFVKLAIFCVVIYLIGIRLFDFGHKLFYEKAMSDGDGETIVFEIKKGDTVEEIAENLKNAGLIDDTLVFKFRAKIYETNFTPNIYNLNTNMTPKNILDIFDSPTGEYIKDIESENDVYQLSPEDEGEGVEEVETSEATSEGT